MSGPYPTGQRYAQQAREAVKGTDLPATSRIFLPKLVFTPEDVDFRPPTARGLMLRSRGDETVTKRWTAYSIDGDATFEQLQHLFNRSVANVTTPTGPTPYIWLHVRNPATANPALASYTFERHEYDGTTAIDDAIHYAMCTNWTLSGAEGEPIKFSEKGFGRKVLTETVTPAIAMPAVEIPVMGHSSLFIDPSWATLGTTPVLAQMSGWSIEFLTGIEPRWTGDNRSDLDFTDHVVNGDLTGLQVKIMMWVGTQYATELAAAEANTVRAIRLQLDGSASRQLQLDFLAKFTRPSLRVFGERLGQTLVELDLQEATDNTNFFSAKLSNLAATLT